MRCFFIPLCLCLMALPAFAQKTVMKYPVDFHGIFMVKNNYASFILANEQENRAAIALKDGKQVSYVLVDNKFKIIDTFSREIKVSYFRSKVGEYLGGAGTGNVYHFVYNAPVVSGLINDIRNYQQQTVDFGNKTITAKPLFEVEKDEKFLVAFNDNNIFYALTANNKTSELLFHLMDGKGAVSTQKVPLKVPASAGKNRNQLSEYLAGAMVVKQNMEPDFSQAVHLTKLFIQPGKLHFVINEEDNPTHVVTINLPDFSVKEKFFDHRQVLSNNAKGNVYVNSYVWDNKIFSLVLNKKSIRVAIFNFDNNQLLGNLEINEDNYTSLIAQPAVIEKRMGKKESEKNIDSFKSLVKELTKGTEGLMVTTTKTGQYVVTVGTYDFMTGIAGHSGGGYDTHPNGPMSAKVSPVSNVSYNPGVSIYSSQNARYYKAAIFRLLIDPATYKAKRGRVPIPVSDQVKNYVERIEENNATATNQFSMGGNQYLGYYNKDIKAYLISQIRVVQ